MNRLARRRRSLLPRCAASVAVAALMLASCTRDDARGPYRAAAPARPTFANDIASIVFAHCAPCHHPGGSGPFSLLTYQDVTKRAKQIVEVTSTRYMPPWPPEPGYGEFIGERRLHDEGIDTVRRWVEAGAPEGDPAELPPAPVFHDQWQLGVPDVVVRLDRPYTLPAEGDDVFRNFILPVPIAGARYVRAVEIRPGNKAVVHHANLLVDRSGALRQRDVSDPEVGFAGMDVETAFDSFEPESHFLFWKAGSPPMTEPADMAWRVDPNTDLVLNMHLRPSGKPETLQPEVGLYFTDQAPSRFPMLLQLEHDGAIDIPPGAHAFIVTDEYRLPVDVDLLGAYPHAHYLGKDIQGFATLPDGTRRWLIWIKDWDFNWQAVYQYTRPIFLPKGSTIAMRITYDNSAANPRNPSDPPRRVTAGNRSSDEMAHLWVQVLPRRGEDRLLLQEALMRRRLEKYPGEFVAQTNLGAVLQSLGRLDEAIVHLRSAVQARPDDARARNNLGAALRTLGRLAEADVEFRAALAADPDYLDAHYNLGNALLGLGRPAEAVPHFRRILRARADDADVHNDLGSALAMQGDVGRASAHFERALAIDRDHRYAHGNLAQLLVAQGKLAQAAAHYERAVQLNPDDTDARKALERLRAQIARPTAR